MRTSPIALTLAGITLSPATACGPTTPADDDDGTSTSTSTGTEDPPATTTSGSTEDIPTSDPTTPFLTSEATDTQYYSTFSSYDDTSSFYECYVDEDCSPGSACDFGFCTPVPQNAACEFDLVIEHRSAPLSIEGSFVIATLLLDLDGDGDLDAAVVDRGAPEIELLRNDGDGLFIPDAVVPIDGGSEPTAAAVADVDGDGAPDVLVLSNTDPGSLAILRNAGGQLEPPSFIELGLRPQRLAVADVNGDTFLDVAVVGQDDPAIDLLLGDGAGAFDPGPPDNNVFTIFTDIAAGPVNADAFPDLVSVGGNVGATLSLGDGAGNFANFGSLPGLGSNQSIRVALGDLDGGGDGPDVVAATERYDGGVLTHWRRTSDDGAFSDARQSSFPEPIDHVRLVDLDADGTLEAVTLADNATQMFATFNLTGDAPCNARIPADDDAPLRTVAAADLDGDGRTDLLSVTDDQLRTFLPRP